MPKACNQREHASILPSAKTCSLEEMIDREGGFIDREGTIYMPVRREDSDVPQDEA